jgi:hypothetical protein
LDVEGLADLLWGLALDHVGHGLAANVKEGLDIEVVCSLVAVSKLFKFASQIHSRHTRMISNSIS